MSGVEGTVVELNELIIRSFLLLISCFSGRSDYSAGRKSRPVFSRFIWSRLFLTTWEYEESNGPSLDEDVHWHRHVTFCIPSGVHEFPKACVYVCVPLEGPGSSAALMSIHLFLYPVDSLWQEPKPPLRLSRQDASGAMGWATQDTETHPSLPAVGHPSQSSWEQSTTGDGMPLKCLVHLCTWWIQAR